MRIGGLSLLAEVRRYLECRRKVVGYALVILVVGLLFLGLIRNWRYVDWSVYRLDVRYLLLSLIPHALGLGLGGVVWALIVLKVESGQGFWRSFRIYFLSNIGRNLPGGIWHIAGRVYLYKRAGASKATAAVATGVELLLAVWAGAATYTTGLLLRPVQPLIPREWLIALLFLLGILLCPPVFNGLVNWFVSRSAGESKTPVAVGVCTILRWVVLYLIIIFVGGIVLFLVGNAIYPLDWEALPSVAGAWGISMAVGGLTFWIPVRIGIRDGILAVALSEQMPFSAAVIVAAMWRVWISISEVVWALVAACVGRLRSE
ncbi:MAG TPA: hypothetical protein ENI39_04450 [Anaerolineae bacterium]|nr:hypothetical protein [Anaerolineae bacterium]